MQNLFTGRFRSLAIGLSASIALICIVVAWVAVVFGFAYTLDFAFKGGGAFSIAFNKVIIAGFTLLPGYLCYLLLLEFTKAEVVAYSSFSIGKKLAFYCRHIVVMLVVCAGIAYLDWSTIDEFGSFDDGEPLTTNDKNAVFFRLLMVCTLGMALAYRKFIMETRRFPTRG